MSVGRPLLRTSYQQDAAMFPTMFQKVALAIFLVLLVLMPFDIPILNQIPLYRFLGDSKWLVPMGNLLIFAIAAIGINIIIGVAGQVSLGHAFFMGVGAYTAVVLGGEGRGGVAACVPFVGEGRCGLELPIWIWLPASAAAAALVGILVSPAAVKVRGLYLAFVTIALVFIGQHLGRMFPQYAGDPETGRRWPALDIRLWREEQPLVTMSEPSVWFGFLELDHRQKQYFFLLALVIVTAIMAKNLMRSRTGRAFAAIRDRDVAAEIMGVPEFRYKMIAFALSSAYAGLAGALFASFNGRLGPPTWSLLLSVLFVAILLIGGAGTLVGTFLGAAFVVLLPHLVEVFTEGLAHRAGQEGVMGFIANLVISTGPGDFGPIAVGPTGPGWPMSVFQWNLVIFGVLIVVFLIFEPRGLFGIWTKIRNYWKGWPFSY
jgi:branched-chain amino acid transport system permease protein